MKLPKETTSLREHGKWYQDACGTAFAMELVGERWSMLVIRELMLGGRRFSDLRASLPGISAKVLTERLASLEIAGVLLKRKLPPPAAAQVYELTEWGYHAEPAIQELGRWAARSPGHDPTLPLSPVSLMMSLRTMLNRRDAREFDATIGFIVGEESFVCTLTGGKLPITRGEVEGCDVVLSAPDAPRLAALIYDGASFDEWQTWPDCQCTGDLALAQRFLALFSLPPKIG